eukprot:352865-Chlamydomonas_euryale.AAC.1
MHTVEGDPSHSCTHTPGTVRLAGKAAGIGNKGEGGGQRALPGSRRARAAHPRARAHTPARPHLALVVGLHRQDLVAHALPDVGAAAAAGRKHRWHDDVAQLRDGLKRTPEGHVEALLCRADLPRLHVVVAVPRQVARRRQPAPVWEVWAVPAWPAWQSVGVANTGYHQPKQDHTPALVHGQRGGLAAAAENRPWQLEGSWRAAGVRDITRSFNSVWVTLTQNQRAIEPPFKSTMDGWMDSKIYWYWGSNILGLQCTWLHARWRAAGRLAGCVGCEG